MVYAYCIATGADNLEGWDLRHFRNFVYMHILYLIFYGLYNTLECSALIVINIQFVV